jgi:4'-phosphopantetheinyl transferase
MMDVYWLEQTEAAVPPENDWLSESEAVQVSGLRFAKRRADWRLGRWTAKRALAVYLNISGAPQALSAIEIRPAPSGAPEVFLANQPAPIAISLSHRAGTAICAVIAAGGALGCDLEAIEPRSDGFVADFFTTEEQALVARAPAAERPRLLALLWSGKESALKAQRVGLRLDTRSVIVSPVGAVGSRGEGAEGRAQDPALTSLPSYGHDGWIPLQVRYTNGPTFRGYWRHTGNLVRTLVADPPPHTPIRLKDSVSACAQAKKVPR